MKIEPIEGSETSAILNQTQGNYPKENLLYSVHGESLKSRIKHKEDENKIVVNKNLKLYL